MNFVLKFSDTESWQTVDGAVVPWELFEEKIILPTRPAQRIPATEEISTKWGGLTYLVQAQTWPVFEVELIANERQAVALKQLRYTDTATVTDDEGNHLYTILPQYFTIEEPESLGRSEHLRLSAKFRTLENSIIINKQTSPPPGATELYLYSLKTLDADFTALGYGFSIFSNLPTLTDERATSTSATQLQGVATTDRVVTYSVLRYRCFLNETDKNQLQKYVQACRASIGTNIDRVQPTEFLSCTDTTVSLSPETPPAAIIAGQKVETPGGQVRTLTGNYDNPDGAVEAEVTEAFDFSETETGHFRLVTNANYATGEGTPQLEVKDTGGVDLYQCTIEVPIRDTDAVYELHK